MADDFRARAANPRRPVGRRESGALSLEQSRGGLPALSRAVWIGAGVSLVLLVDAASCGDKPAYYLADHAAASGAVRLVCGRGNAFPMGIARCGVRFVGRGADRLEKHQKRSKPESQHRSGMNAASTE